MRMQRNTLTHPHPSPYPAPPYFVLLFSFLLPLSHPKVPPAPRRSPRNLRRSRPVPAAAFVRSLRKGSALFDCLRKTPVCVLPTHRIYC